MLSKQQKNASIKTHTHTERERERGWEFTMTTSTIRCVMTQIDWIFIVGCVGVWWLMSSTSDIYWVDLGFINN